MTRSYSDIRIKLGVLIWKCLGFKFSTLSSKNKIQYRRILNKHKNRLRREDYEKI